MGKVWNAMDAKIEAAIKASGQKKCRLIYSAYDTDPDDEEDEPIDNLDQVAVAGRVVLVNERDEFWGGKKSKDYRSPVLDSPTWLEVCVYANEMIKVTRDRHHAFLEGLSLERAEDGVNVFRFDMGS